MEELDRSETMRIAAALGHPVRRRLFILLLSGASPDPRHLAALTEAPIGRIRYHLRVLIDSGADLTPVASVTRGWPGLAGESPQEWVT